MYFKQLLNCFAIDMHGYYTLGIVGAIDIHGYYKLAKDGAITDIVCILIS